jgi:hypothetical protein
MQTSVKRDLEVFCLKNNCVVKGGYLQFKDNDHFWGCAPELLRHELIYPQSFRSNVYERLKIYTFSSLYFFVKIGKFSISKETFEEAIPDIEIDHQLRVSQAYRDMLPLTDEEITTIVLRNGKYIFDDHAQLVKTLTWLMDKGIVSLDPKLGKPPSVMYNGYERALFTVKPGRTVGWKTSFASAAEFTGRDFGVNLHELTVGRRLILDRIVDCDGNRTNSIA